MKITEITRILKKIGRWKKNENDIMFYSNLMETVVLRDIFTNDTDIMEERER